LLQPYTENPYVDYLPSNKKRLVYHQPVEALNPQLLINNEPSIFKGALLPYAFMIINESEIKMFCICILCEAMVSL
ncbi:MAG: hypothetical protein KIG23_07995, partial [Erysipelotrichaceae bacterium]|nr:hypothetical protein [Erysipelotrichaceae bacterium]